jgi:hemicentin
VRTAAPHIEREGVADKIDVPAGARTSISCPSFGRPDPTVSWLRNGQPLGQSARGQQQQQVVLSANGQRLHLLQMTEADAGRYTCVATNAAGEDKRDFNVEIQSES